MEEAAELRRKAPLYQQLASATQVNLERLADQLRRAPAKEEAFEALGPVLLLALGLEESDLGGQRPLLDEALRRALAGDTGLMPFVLLDEDALKAIASAEAATKRPLWTWTLQADAGVRWSPTAMLSHPALFNRMIDAGAVPQDSRLVHTLLYEGCVRELRGGLPRLQEIMRGARRLRIADISFPDKRLAFLLDKVFAGPGAPCKMSFMLPGLQERAPAWYKDRCCTCGDHLRSQLRYGLRAVNAAWVALSVQALGPSEAASILRRRLRQGALLGRADAEPRDVGRLVRALAPLADLLGELESLLLQGALHAVVQGYTTSQRRGFCAGFHEGAAGKEEAPRFGLADLEWRAIRLRAARLPARHLEQLAMWGVGQNEARVARAAYEGLLLSNGQDELGCERAFAFYAAVQWRDRSGWCWMPPATAALTVRAALVLRQPQAAFPVEFVLAAFREGAQREIPVALRHELHSQLAQLERGGGQTASFGLAHMQAHAAELAAAGLRTMKRQEAAAVTRMRESFCPPERLQALEQRLRPLVGADCAGLIGSFLLCPFAKEPVAAAGAASPPPCPGRATRKRAPSSNGMAPPPAKRGSPSPAST